jgi:signal transduction histidine kinase
MLGFTSYIAVPLIAHERTLGTITLVSATSGRRYTEADLALAEDLAQHAALAIDNARLYHEAQEALRTRDQFLSIASHELKTPLTSLLGYAELLERRTARERTLPQRDQNAVQVIVKQASQLSKMVTSLLDLSRIQTGQLSTERVPLDLGGLVERAVMEVQPTLDRHTLRFNGPDEPLIVEGDDVRLEQVLQNLIGNAIKYSPEGGPVSIRLSRRNGQAYIEVADEGIGIPAPAQARLFQRFYRAGNVDPEQVGGLGIGLYVVKEIVAMHGGQIDVASEEGKGSSFTVRLPLKG